MEYTTLTAPLPLPTPLRPPTQLRPPTYIMSSASYPPTAYYLPTASEFADKSSQHHEKAFLIYSKFIRFSKRFPLLYSTPDGYFFENLSPYSYLFSSIHIGTSLRIFIFQYLPPPHGYSFFKNNPLQSRFVSLSFWDFSILLSNAINIMNWASLSYCQYNSNNVVAYCS